MGMSFLCDTNVAIYFLNDQFDEIASEFVDNTIKVDSAKLSVISELELLSWNPKTHSDIFTIQRFVDDCNVLELDDLTKIYTVDIRRRYKLKLPDAIIAATAIANDLTLVSRNCRDFKKVKQLQFVNPFDSTN